jgi:hypothetical protein
MLGDLVSMMLLLSFSTTDFLALPFKRKKMEISAQYATQLTVSRSRVFVVWHHLLWQQPNQNPFPTLRKISIGHIYKYHIALVCQDIQCNHHKTFCKVAEKSRAHWLSRIP